MNIIINEEVRKTAKNAKVPLWAIAEALQISEPTMTRKMRHELPDEEKKRILAIIANIAAKHNDSV